MNTIDKGIISSMKDGGAKAEVVPYSSKGAVTLPLVVPNRLKGYLEVNNEVAFIRFPDNTGIIIERMDGVGGAGGGGTDEPEPKRLVLTSSDGMVLTSSEGKVFTVLQEG